jgi:hypothetical protein
VRIIKENVENRNKADLKADYFVVENYKVTYNNEYKGTNFLLTYSNDDYEKSLKDLEIISQTTITLLASYEYEYFYDK